MSDPRALPRHSTRTLLREFVVVDVIAFVVIGVAVFLLGASEVIVGMVAGYMLGFQTGGESA